MAKRVSATSIAALLEQASRLIHSAGHAEGLYPAQWSALRYFAEAPAQNRTTASLARFQGMNLGPVARTVRTLVEKGLLVRTDNPRSRRADLLAPSPAGHDLLRRDPRRDLAARIAALTEVQQQVLADALETLLQGMFRDWKGGDAGRPPGVERTGDA
ncbi:MarR family winged helix-turn-helix transcriptional regulator [Arenibaculum sp.]|jgi:DNA-binding MarR family transcriptional regulator|uniref:MarR family winged helix-turn-helix transcriptional regulator n=1 Tax=Arenibaculum sp. TaxID=2865862 RepID=UPI002E1304F5|nr:MarR family transcriptional regulator [Arenibaculum sp.]